MGMLAFIVTTFTGSRGFERAGRGSSTTSTGNVGFSSMLQHLGVLDPLAMNMARSPKGVAKAFPVIGFRVVAANAGEAGDRVPKSVFPGMNVGTLSFMVAVGTKNKEASDENIGLFDVTLHFPLDRSAVAGRVRGKTTTEQIVLRDVGGPLRGQPLPKLLMFDKESTVDELFLHVLCVFGPKRKKAVHDGQSFFDSHTWYKIEFGSMIGESGSGQSQFGYTGSRK